MKKLLSILTTFLLVIGIFANVNAPTSQATTWDTERYGDLLDAGTQIRALEKDEEYRAEQDAQLLERAATFNMDAQQAANLASSDFTFEGPEKIFVGYDPIFGNYLKYYTLRSLGDNVEVWVANDLAYYTPIFDEEGHWDGEVINPERPAHVITQEQVDRMRDVFDEVVYPTDTDFFGTPDSHTGENALFTLWGFGDFTPESYVPEGYETKERVIILVDNIRDENYYMPTYPFIIGGFYSPTFQDYFDRNVISIDSSNWEERLEEDWLPTTAHEFQHLIHDDNDPSEETWINEGMSDFAEYLCFGEHPWSHVNFFLDHPENSLVEWDEHEGAITGPETLADYGQAYLFQLYLLDKYGKDFVRALALNELQGIASTNQVLEDFNTEIDFEELFRRFSIAVAIDNEKPEQGIYNFESIDLSINFESALDFDKDGVPAWGADYKVLEDGKQIQNMIFDGIQFMPIPWQIVEDPERGQVLWGNNGHLIDNQLIFEADLTNATDATLTFDTLIDIEAHWDAGMVQVSTDNGETWVSLSNEHTVAQEDFPFNDQAPDVYANLPGFSHNSTEWATESFNLDTYIGQEILINFRYMTDAAYNDSGWFIDDIEIESIGYYNDCNSLDNFYSIDEIRDIKVEYAVSFINRKSYGVGKKDQYQIINIDPFNITEDNVAQLQGFLNHGINYMIVWYAAPEGKKGTVDFSYEIIRNKAVKDKK